MARLNTDYEPVELALIARDADDAIRSVLGMRHHPDIGHLSFSTFPLSGLVLEESLIYFEKRKRAARFGQLDAALTDEFRRSVKKIRAHVKLFDDTQEGATGVVDLMNLVRAKSAVLFSHASSPLLQWISKGFRPDVGVFFDGDHIIMTSHAALPSIGFSRERIQAFQPGGFDGLGAFSRPFAEAVGRCLRGLAAVLSALDIQVNLNPDQVHASIQVTYNDFASTKFYKAVGAAVGGDDKFLPTLTWLLSYTNSALRVLPTILDEDSNLLLRFQFMTAFHASSTLRVIRANVGDWSLDGDDDLFKCKAVRNMLAHYELPDVPQSVLRSRDPLGEAIASCGKVTRADVKRLARERLASISAHLGSRLTKGALQPVRALLGKHT